MIINRDYISAKTTYAQNNPKYIVVHETDNFSKGANAKRHASAQAAGHLSCSVHYYSGSDGVYQAASHTRGTYSVGKEYGGNHSVHDATNRNTINIEICVNPDGDYSIAWQNCVDLVKYLMKETGIPSERVIRHFDAKGKYCPRKMMDDPSLWKKFKSAIGSVIEIDTTPNEIVESKEVWYRIGTNWSNGICIEQIGAYKNKDIAIRDCIAGYKVFDNEGLVIYTHPISIPFAGNGYELSQFVREVQHITGSKVDGIAGEETLGNTITVSRQINKFHPIITPLERRLKHLGFYSGYIEADKNESPCFGLGLEAAVNAYQKHVLSYETQDGEITAKKKMWMSLLGMDID